MPPWGNITLTFLDGLKGVLFVRKHQDREQTEPPICLGKSVFTVLPWCMNGSTSTKDA